MSAGTRWAWAEIDLDAIAHNVRILRQRVAPAAVWAVVKADGYGHGAVDVARAAVAAGATLWNDVGAANGAAAADLGVAGAAMHAQGEPAPMQRAPRYDDVVAEVRHELVTRAEAALAAGVPAVRIDPGIGVGKTFEHNLALLAHLDELVATGHPVLVGTSRKGFLGALLGSSDGAPGPAPVEDRLEGSLTTATWAMTSGAGMIRAHDVRATAHAALVIGGHTTKDAAA
jgi:dihydropteroate synthase